MPLKVFWIFQNIYLGEILFSNLKQYGEIEDCQIDDSSLHAVITFKTRVDAEVVSIKKNLPKIQI